MPTESYWQTNAPMFVLAGVAIAWYAGVRALCDTFARSPSDGATKIGLVYSLPVLLFGICGVVGGQPQFALGAIFSSSVAAMTLVAGLLVCTSVLFPSSEIREWTRLLPTTAILLLAGFSGRLGLLHGSILLVQGVMVLWVVREPQEITLDDDAEILTDRSGGIVFGALQSILALAILTAASWAAWKALSDLQGKFSSVPAHSLTSLLVAPAMVLPMLGTGMTLAHEGRAETAVTSLVTFVQINTCILFPFLIGSTVVRNTVRIDGPLTEKFVALLDPDNALLLPAGVWRIDVVFLMFCALMLLPAGWKQWSLGKVEGAILACLYIVYLFLITIVR